MTDSAFIKKTASGAKAWGQFILAIATAQSELDLCTVVVEHLPAFICADRVSITHLTDNGTTFKITAVNGAKQVLAQGQHVPFEETSLQLAITTQRPQLFEAQLESPYFDLRELAKQGMVQVIHVPLVLSDQAIGSLNISARMVIPDPEAVIEFMEQIAILLAMNLERHTLYHQTRFAMERYRSQAKQLRVLNEIGRRLSAAVTRAEVFDVIAQAISQVINVERVSYAVPTPDRQGFEVFRFSGNQYIPTGMVLPAHNSGLQKVYESEKPTLFADLTREEHSEHRLLASFGLKVGWSVPVCIADQIIGILNAASSRTDLDGQEQLDLLTTLGGLMGATLERIEMQDQAATVLQHDEARVRSLIDDSPLLLIVVNEAGHIDRVSEFGASQLGYDAAALAGQPFEQLHPITEQETTRDRVRRLLNLPNGDIKSEEVQMLCADGRLIWANQTSRRVQSEEGRPELLVCCEDVSAVRSLTDQLEYRAHYDNLTHLPNRALFYQALERELALAQTHRQQVAVLFIDLDRFKQVNDTLGHAMGDKLLCAIAQKLQQILRPPSMVARLGGDEFVVLMPRVSQQHTVEQTAQGILQALASPLKIDRHSIFLGGSIGVSLFPDHGDTLDTLMKHADLAMYHAKEQGRNNHQIYTPELSTKLQRRIAIEHALREAIASNSLSLVFHPQINLTSGCIEGLEALVRWDNSPVDPITPSQFIPIAEESGLIEALSDWVLDQSLRTIKQLRQHYPQLYVAVNFSAQEFAAPTTLLKRITTALETHQLSGNALELEITENVFLQTEATTKQLISTLKDEGVSVAIDDFGTGFSSLSYLINLPFDTLKIDRSFIHQLGQDQRNDGIVRGTIEIAKSLDMSCVAEGVETLEQLSHFQALDCQRCQGFLFSKPLPASELEALLQQDLSPLLKASHKS